MTSDPFRTSLYRRLAQAAAAGGVVPIVLYACGGEVVVIEDDGSTSSGAGASGGIGNGGDPGVGASGGVGAQGGQSATGGAGTRCGTIGTGSTGSGFSTTVCLDSLGVPCPSDTVGAQALAQQAFDPSCCQPPVYQCNAGVSSVDCGPYATSEGRCCFDIFVEPQPCAVPGRPLTTPVEPRTARPTPRRDWIEEAPSSTTPLSASCRALLAEHWTREALYEHASIASFARFTLELLSVGAPADLVRGAQLAALDEIRHASLAFGIASRYRGEPVGPTTLALEGVTEPRTTLIDVAVATFEEGCIGETVAAVLAAERAARTTDSFIKGALTAIAEDEARHAELAWRTVAWAVQQGGAPVRAALEACLAEALRRSSDPESPAGHDWPDEAMAHGVFSPDQEAQSRERTLREIVAPVARTLAASS